MNLAVFSRVVWVIYEWHIKQQKPNGLFEESILEIINATSQSLLIHGPYMPVQKGLEFLKSEPRLDKDTDAQVEAILHRWHCRDEAKKIEMCFEAKIHRWNWRYFCIVGMIDF